MVLAFADLRADSFEDELLFDAAIQKLRTGTPDVAGEGHDYLYRTLRPRLRGYIYRLIQDDPRFSSSDIDDIFQITMMEVWATRERLPEGGNAIPFIFRISANRKRSYLGRWGRMVPSDVLQPRNGITFTDPLLQIPYRPITDFALEELSQPDALPVVRPDFLERVLARIPVEKRAEVPDWLVRYVASISVGEISEGGLDAIIANIHHRRFRLRERQKVEQDRIAQIQQLIEERVPEEQQRVACMRLCDGFGEKEIAEILQLPLEEVIYTYRAAFVNLFPERQTLAFFALNIPEEIVREVFWYFYVEGSPDREIGERLELSESATRYQIERAGEYYHRFEKLGDEKALERIGAENARKQWILDHLEEIPNPKARVAIKAVAVDGLSYKQAKDRIGCTTSSVKGYLKIAWDYLRAHGGPVPGETVMTEEEKQADRRLAEQLPDPEMRNVVLMVDFRGLSQREAMAELGMKLTTFNKRLRDGRQYMQMLREGVLPEDLGKKRAAKNRRNFDSCGLTISTASAEADPFQSRRH